MQQQKTPVLLLKLVTKTDFGDFSNNVTLLMIAVFQHKVKQTCLKEAAQLFIINCRAACKLFSF